MRRQGWGDEGIDPYKVRCKTQQRTCVTRNVMVSANVPNRATRDICIRRCVNAPLKKEIVWEN